MFINERIQKAAAVILYSDRSINYIIEKVLMSTGKSSKNKKNEDSSSEEPQPSDSQPVSIQKRSPHEADF